MNRISFIYKISILILTFHTHNVDKFNLSVKKMEPIENSGESEKAALLSQETTERLCFTTINSDCMQLIFEHLEWRDLVNVAETCKTFYAQACMVFKRKYSGNKRLAICTFNCPTKQKLSTAW